MLICFFGELRRRSGHQLLNQVFYGRTGNVKWTPLADIPGCQQPAQTFFTTRCPASRLSATPTPLSAITVVFNSGLEALLEALMRIGVTGPSPDNTAV